MFANRISSSTDCSIWQPETSPPSSSRGILRRSFQSCNTSVRSEDLLQSRLNDQFDNGLRHPIRYRGHAKDALSAILFRDGNRGAPAVESSCPSSSGSKSCRDCSPTVVPGFLIVQCP